MFSLVAVVSLVSLLTLPLHTHGPRYPRKKSKCSIRAQLSQLTGAHYKVRYIRHHRFQILLTPHLGHHTLYSHLSQATLHTFCAALATQDSPAREARRSALHTPPLCCAARAALHGRRACQLPHGSLAGLRAACLLPACCLPACASPWLDPGGSRQQHLPALPSRCQQSPRRVDAVQQRLEQQQQAVAAVAAAAAGP